MKDFLKQNFPVILLTALNLLFTFVVLLVFWKFSNNKDAVNWAVTAFTGFMGALLGLITGRAIGAGETPKQPEPPKQP